MSSLKKIEKMAVLALFNGLRLHRDSITLFKFGSIPSSYALSILAQEEFGKHFLLKEIIYQDYENIGLDDECAKETLKLMCSHKIKQGWFSRQADDIAKYHWKKYPKIIKDISSGKLDNDKQNAIYVGVTRTLGKLDLIKGKIIDPLKRIKINKVKFHITRVNDFLIEMIEGSKRGILDYDFDEENDFMTLNLVKELESLWPDKSLESKATLKKYKKYPIDPDC